MKTHEESIFQKSSGGPQFDTPDIRSGETLLIAELARNINNDIYRKLFRKITEQTNSGNTESCKRILRHMLGEEVEGITLAEKRVSNWYLGKIKPKRYIIDLKTGYYVEEIEIPKKKHKRVK